MENGAQSAGSCFLWKESLVRRAGFSGGSWRQRKTRRYAQGHGPGRTGPEPGPTPVISPSVQNWVMCRFRYATVQLCSASPWWFRGPEACGRSPTQVCRPCLLSPSVRGRDRARGLRRCVHPGELADSHPGGEDQAQQRGERRTRALLQPQDDLQTALVAPGRGLSAVRALSANKRAFRWNSQAIILTQYFDSVF